MGTVTQMTNHSGNAVPDTRATARNDATTARSPWARFTMRMTPNTSESPVAKSAYRPPSKRPCTPALTQSTSLPRRYCAIDAEVRPLHLLVAELIGPALEYRPALQQALHAVCHRHRLAHVLLDDQGRGAGFDDPGQDLVDPAYHHRRQPQGQLVDQQQPGVGEQG